MDHEGAALERAKRSHSHVRPAAEFDRRPYAAVTRQDAAVESPSLGIAPSESCTATRGRRIAVLPEQGRFVRTPDQKRAWWRRPPPPDLFLRPRVQGFALP
jgi:hypothetical protein